jgi:hypothetical protein
MKRAGAGLTKSKENFDLAAITDQGRGGNLRLVEKAKTSSVLSSGLIESTPEQ